MVIFENLYGYVDISITDGSAVAVNLSGGADSALLLWMVGMSVVEQDIIIKVIDDHDQKINDDYFKEIISIIKSTFPETTFKYSFTLTDKSIPLTELLNSMPFGASQIFTGVTCNAPKEVRIELGIDEGRELERDPDKIPFPDSYKGQFWPMRFTDKRFLRQMCLDHDLGWIHDLTWTCSAVSNHDRPCKVCVDCIERKQLMGTFDYGEI